MSVNDTVVDEKYEELRASHNPKVVDTYVTVKANAFAVGKQVRDIFWPASLFVLSMKHGNPNNKADKLDSKAIREGDILHVRYTTYNEQQTNEELEAIVGIQE